MAEDSGRIYSLSALRRTLSRESDPDARARSIAEYLSKLFNADRVEIEVDTGLKLIEFVISTNEDKSIWIGADKTLEGPIFVADTNKVRLNESLKNKFAESKVKSFARVPVFANGLVVGSIAIYSIQQYTRWQPLECMLLEALADLCSALICTQKKNIESEQLAPEEVSEALNEIRVRSDRLLEYGNLIIVRTDKKLAITEVHGNTVSVLGYQPEELLGVVNVWSQIVHPEDLRKLNAKVKAMGRVPSELSEEIELFLERVRILLNGLY
ncbi:MAG: GAF domain-containing protein [Bdellovibrionota bacterium]